MARGVDEGEELTRFLVGKTEGKRPLGRYKPRREDNTKMDVQEVYDNRGLE